MLGRRGGFAREKGPARKYLGPKNRCLLLFTALLVLGMGENEKLFSDGEACERRIGRWSRLVGEKFLDWLAIPRGLQ